MRQWCRRVAERVQKLGKSRPVSRQQRQALLGVEALEQRDLMSATPLTWTAPVGNTSNTISLSVVSGTTPVSADQMTAYNSALAAYRRALTAYNNFGWGNPPTPPVAPTPQPYTKLEVFDNGQLVASQDVSSTSAVSLTGAANSSNTFNVLSTAAGIPTTINLGSGADSVVVGQNNSASGIQGALAIQGFQGLGSVSLNDSAWVIPGNQPGGQWSGWGVPATISSSGLSRLSPAGITFSGVSNLSIVGSANNYGNTYSITGTPGTTTLSGVRPQDMVSVQSNSGTVQVFGNGGSITLNGPSSGSSTFTASPNQATFSGNGFSDVVSGFATIAAYSNSAGDSAKLSGPSSGSSTFTANPNSATMTGNGYSNQAIGFQKITGYSNSSGDVAMMYGITGGNNTFTPTPSMTTLSGSGYTNVASGFKNVFSPSAAASFSILVISAGPVAAGTAFNVQVTALDAHGLNAPNFIGTVHFSSSGVGALLPADYTFVPSDSSTHLFSVTANSPGTLTITATATGTGSSGATGISGPITVTPPATQFVVSAPSNQTAGVSFQVSVTAEDVNGNIVPTYNQTPTFSASDGYPVSVSGITWSNGVGTATVKLNNPAITTITAASGTIKGTSNSITVSAPTIHGKVWTGYVVAPTSGATAVGGTWVQPTNPAGPSTDVSTWVGIDGLSLNGFTDNTVEQIGTDAQTDSSGHVTYWAWLEFFGDSDLTKGLDSNGLPANRGPDYLPINLNTFPGYSSFTIHPGDTISAEVSVVPGNTRSFLFQMTDVPKGGGATETFSLVQTMVVQTPQLATAEWIVENPGGGVNDLADFGQVNFTGAWATIGTTTGPINAFQNVLADDMTKTGPDPSIAGTAVVSTNPPIISNTLGYNEPATGGSSSSFVVTGTYSATLVPGPSPGPGQVGILPLTLQFQSEAVEEQGAGSIVAGKSATQIPSAAAPTKSSGGAQSLLVHQTPASPTDPADAVFSVLDSLKHLPGKRDDRIGGGTLPWSI